MRKAPGAAKRKTHSDLRRERREARARKAERARIWRALRSRAFVVSLVLLLIAAIGTATLVVLTHPGPTSVSGSLRTVRSIQFTEASERDGGISPACGCMFPPISDWRGVTFVGRSLNIERAGRSPYTEWAISSADPDSISFDSGSDTLKVEAVRFVPTESGSFDPRWLLNGELRSHGRVVSSGVFHTSRFDLLTNHDLNASMFGRVPVGAWIPFPGSGVSLGRAATAFPDEPTAPQLLERYPNDIGREAWEEGLHPNSKEHVNFARAEQAYPAFDLLGPDLVFWSADPVSQIGGTFLKRRAGPGVITALIIRGSTFSVRTRVIPLAKAGLHEYEAEDAAHPKRALGNVFFNWGDGGAIRLTVRKPLTSASYASLRTHVADHPLTWVSNSIDQDRTEERYPPLPRDLGFNVFGPLSILTLGGASGGSLLVRDRTIPIGAPATIKLTDIRALNEQASDGVIPLPLSTSEKQAGLQFQAVGAVSVNGEEETTFFQRHDVVLPAIGLVATLLAAAASVLGFVRSVGRRHTTVEDR
jgi:hypothetical protein